VDETDDGVLWSNSEEDGNVRSEREEDKGIECDAVCNILTQHKLFISYIIQRLTSILHVFILCVFLH
jgi:hypothetical protein